MVTSTQTSLVPYRTGYDIIIPRGPEPVHAVKTRDKALFTTRATPYIHRRAYAYTAPKTDFGNVYSATGAPAALATDTVGRIIDIHA
ncbi:MAG: hypothetical protein JEZ11_18375 [Desulfobacterales bacterium]|nr:hypothetical protein [Desulfobacterales bacterium]